MIFGIEKLSHFEAGQRDTREKKKKDGGGGKRWKEESVFFEEWKTLGAFLSRLPRRERRNEKDLQDFFHGIHSMETMVGSPKIHEDFNIRPEFLSMASPINVLRIGKDRNNCQFSTPPIHRAISSKPFPELATPKKKEKPELSRGEVNRNVFDRPPSRMFA